MSSTADHLDRFRVLVDAGIALTSELSLDALLRRVAETAAALTEARYAALGVIDETGEALERFITVGVDESTHAAIGDLPRGRGILGALIRDARPLRLADLTEDPRSVGFPRHHPAMKTFLGVPIMLRGVAFGNLYLTEKAGGEEFTEEDEELTLLLAAQAAVAIENARLYESATRWSRQLASLTEIGNAISSELELPRLLDLVTRRLRELLGARVVAIALRSGDAVQVEAAAGEQAETLLGVDLAGFKVLRVLDRRRSERIDRVLDDPEVDQGLARRVGARAALFVPLLARDDTIGVVLAIDKDGRDPRFTDQDLRLAESFAGRAAVAVDLSQRVAKDAVRRVIEAQELERKRLARELHDETGQALTSILLGLKPLEDALNGEARAKVGSLRELVVSTLQDVRRLAVELRPTALDDFGLAAALERLVGGLREHGGLDVDFDARLGDERLAPEVETALYRIVQEALTNVVKHAGARHVGVVLTRRDGAVVAMVEDDGRGFDTASARAEGLGLVGMRERAALVGGTLQIESGEGGGTTVVAQVPQR
jgi:signal transduction histidine kinase